MEYHLHYIWLNRLFSSLIGVGIISNADIEVLDPGIVNDDSGADFFNAKVRINGMLWVGNIEIHTNSNQWYTHKHDKDESHKNTILHIVEKFDGKDAVCLETKIPTAIMSYDKELIETHRFLGYRRNHLCCKELLPLLHSHDIRYWMDINSNKRNEYKSFQISELMSELSLDWDEIFYRLMMRYFGFNLNNDSMLEIAETLPYKILLKHRDNKMQMEALLLGQANLLCYDRNIKDEYITALEKEYYFLSRMYNLHPINKYPIKFLRTRPQGFPTRRLAQIASIINKTDSISSDVLKTFDLNKIKELFISDVSEYWKTNYSFKSQTSRKKDIGRLSESSINSIIINVVIPFKYVYHYNQNDIDNAEKTLNLLTKLPFESNKITRLFNMNLENKTAKESQSLIHIYKNYCTKKDCISCHWGKCLASNKL